MVHDYQQILVVLSAALGLSFTIERILQVLKIIFDKVLFRVEALTPETSSRAEEVIDDMENRHDQDAHDALVEELGSLRVQLEKEKGILTPAQKAKIRSRIRELENQNIDTSKSELDEKFSQATVFVDSIQPADRMKIMRTFWLQILGTFGGVVICTISHFGMFAKLAGDIYAIPAYLDYLFSGILIGAGSQPMHFLIEFITRRKITVLKTAPAEAADMPQEKVAYSTPANGHYENGDKGVFSEIAIQYRGGIDVHKLEWVHLRPINPDCIVYHHTAMHSDTSFADVVKVIKDKGWLTGYHCVVLKDGSIHSFCRWDRYGNHAKGYNLTSLGIALNGNFDANPLAVCANVNGSYGLTTPSEVQLFAAAKVIALWTTVYNIPLDFSKSILSHRDVGDTACPGSNFPYAQFQEIIKSIYQKWEKSPDAKQEIAVFQKNPFVFV